MAIVKRERHKMNESKKAKIKGWERAGGKDSTGCKRTQKGRKNGEVSVGGKKTKRGRKIWGGKRTKKPAPAAGDSERKKQGSQRKWWLCCRLSLTIDKLLRWLLLTLVVVSPSLIAYFFLQGLLYHYLRYCLQP